MKLKSIEDLKEKAIDAINEIQNFHRETRAFTPYLTHSCVGVSSIVSPPYYKESGFNYTICYGKLLNEHDITHLNILANWINQNVLIRLCALMEYYKFIGGRIIIDDSVTGWEKVELLIALRNAFAHTNGSIGDNAKRRELARRVNQMFDLKLNDIDTRDQIPLSIDTVIDLIFNACRLYIINIKEIKKRKPKDCC
jgi:hypothetical protein